jgi:hypothetical protein
MEIKAPKTVKDLRIKHFAALSHPAMEAQPDLEGMALFISEALELPYDTVLECDLPDMLQVYHHLCAVYSHIRIQDPPKEITLAGVEYRRIDPHKDGTGWHIDFSKSDIKEDPVRLACLFYYPKAAKKYGEKDQNGNLLYPIASRYDIFKEHFPLEVFINSTAFFLTKIERLARRSMETRRVEKKLIELLRPMSGRTSSTQLQRSTTEETGTK